MRQKLGMYRVNHLSLTLLGGDGARLDGFALSLLRNHSRLNLRGMQLSLLGLNQVGHQAIGFQFALLGNNVGADFYGLQLALVNVVMGRMTGLQISPALGLAFDSAHGFLVAGLSNINLGELRGVQIGVVNLAHRVNGAQVGIVNLADEINGAPLGLLSLARKGQWHGEMRLDNMHMTNLGFQLGNELANSLRLAVRYQIFSRLAFKAGLSFNFALNTNLDQAVLTPLPRWEMRPAAPQLSLWPGAFAGLVF